MLNDTPALQGHQELYLTGGNNGESWLDAVEVYNPSQGSWYTVQPMPLERGYGAAAAIGRQLYVMGGGNGESWLQSCMMCNVDDGDWIEVSAGVDAHHCYVDSARPAALGESQGKLKAKPHGAHTWGRVQ